MSGLEWMLKRAVAESIRKHQNTQPERVILDPNGDVVLAISKSNYAYPLKKEFLVSSTVLCLASNYFKALLRSNFKEASELRTEVCPTITLEDDDVEAMRVILSVLHLKHQESWCNELQVESIATIAVLCDKYDCVEALRPWSSVWLTINENTNVSAHDLGILLSAAYLFRSARALETISAAAIRRVSTHTAAAWPEQRYTALLPDGIIGKWIKRLPADCLSLGTLGYHCRSAFVQCGIQSVLRDLGTALSRGQSNLRDNAAKAIDCPDSWICRNCRGIASAKHCPKCINSSTEREPCTRHDRVRDYFFLTMEDCDWPSVEKSRDFSAAEIVEHIKSHPDPHQNLQGRRWSRVKKNCEVHRVMDEVFKGADEILANIKGITAEKLLTVSWLKGSIW